MTKLLLPSPRASWLIGLALLCGPVAGETVGYSHKGGQIYRLTLDAGSGDILWQVESATELGGISGALARSADGHLFAANSWWPNDNRLAVIEPQTGSFDFVGTIAGALWTDLTFDDQGRLWMVDAAELYLVDTSDATATPVSIDPADLMAVGSHAGTLFAIVGEGFDRFWLVKIDPDSGTSLPVVELQGFFQGDCFAEAPISMAFDDAGGLWVVVAEWFGTCIIPTVGSAYLYFPQPADGVPGPRRRLAPGGPGFLPALEVLGRPRTVEIPTLSATGSSLLAALVLFAGLSTIRRSRRLGAG